MVLRLEAKWGAPLAIQYRSRGATADRSITVHAEAAQTATVHAMHSQLDCLFQERDASD